MKPISIITRGILPFVASVLLLSGCGGSDSANNDTNTTDSNITDSNSTQAKSFILTQNEEANVSINAKVLAQTADTKVKITRDVEKEAVNIYVVQGSVEVQQF